MAQQQANDYADDVVDPNELEANIQDGEQQNIARAQNSSQRMAAVTQASANQLGVAFSQVTGDQSVGDPKVVQARRIQSAMQQILQSSNQGADPNETALDRQERISTAVSAGMANVSPQIAMKAAQQGVAIQEAKQQQELLQANVQRVKQVTQEDQTKIYLQKVGAVYQVHGTTIAKDGLPDMKSYGDPVSLYNEDGSLNPDFKKQLLSNVAQAKAAGAQSPQWSTVDKFNDSKMAVQTARAQSQMAIQALKDQDKAKLTQAAADLSDDTIKFYAGQSALLGPAALSRQPPATRNAITAYKAAHGIQPADEVQAQAEIVGLKSGERAIGTRAGNTAILQQELTGLAGNVQDALAKVDRTKIPMINAAIRAGAIQALGSGPEAAYAAALQAFTTAHGRLIAGASGGITSDAARDQASALVTGTQSPEAVKDALNQIVSKEVPVIRSASDSAIGMMANRGKYPGINKISSALGYSMDSILPKVEGSAQAPQGNSYQLANPQPASTGWGKAMKIGS